MTDVEKKIFFLGDDVEDTILISPNKHLDPSRSSNYDLPNRNIVTMHKKHGGTQTLATLFNRLKTGFVVLKADTPVKGVGGLSEWEQKDATIQARGKKPDKKKRSFLVKHFGFFDDADEKNSGKFSTKRGKKELALSYKNFEDLKKSKIIAIYNMSNHNMYCSQEQLEDLRKSDSCQFVLFRTMFSNGKKPTAFFERFFTDKKLVPKTILLFNVNELRREGFNIQKGTTWELLVTQTITALEYIKEKYVYEKQSFKAIVVCFNNEGCLIISGNSGKLFFYPNEIEGDFVLRHGKYVFGSVTVMQAALALALSSSDSEHVDALLSEGVKRGLVAMRHLVEIGFTDKVNFPYAEIANAIKEPCDDVKTRGRVYPSSCDIRGDMSKDDEKNFSIIETVSANEKITGKNNADGKQCDPWVFARCKEIVTNGKTDDKIPYLRYEKLITYDKFEIEQLRDIHQLFRSYVHNTDWNRPLSICVFGPPGSGKSFAVEQIAESIANTETEKTFKFKTFKFNVSQMKGSEELVTAFHQIRDAGLKGECPVVFFDEFDSKLACEKFGWLKYFLAPMQDGEFTQKGHPHFIGRAIFIFAGGTYYSMQTFKDATNTEYAKLQKAPDFLSRLKGHINILGPNRQCPHGKELSKKTFQCPYDKDLSKKTLGTCSNNNVDDCKMSKQTCGEPIQNICEQKNVSQQCETCTEKTRFCDFGYYLRRATLLRSLLEKKLDIKQDTPIEIDYNVLTAFINVAKYSYGARSLDAIIQTSDIIPEKAFSESCLNKACLEMYVDETFNSYLRKEYENDESNRA